MKRLMTWIRKLCQPTPAARRQPRSVRLGLDLLEDRTVPSTMTWDGGADGGNIPSANANWSSPQNWVGDVAPAAGDDLVFPASALQLASVNDYAAGTVFNSLSLAGTYNLTGNALALTGGVRTSNTTGVNTLGMPLTLAADQVFTSLAGGTNLRLTGATLDNGGHTLTFDGTGDFQVNDTITGAGGLTKNGAGHLILQNSAPNTYAGPTTVNAGSLEPSAANALPASPLTIGQGGTGAVTATVRLAGAIGINRMSNTAPITINSGGTLDLNGYNQTTGALTLVGGQINTGTGTLTLNGDVTSLQGYSASFINGNLNLGNTPVRNFITGPGAFLVVQSGVTSGAGVQLVKQGTGRLNLNYFDSYSGGTLVSQGALYVGATTSLGAVGTTTTVSAGASLYVYGGASLANYSLVLNGAGAPGSEGALVGVSGSPSTATWTGQITLASPTTISAVSGVKLNLTGVVTGSGNLTVTGPGEVVLAGANTHTGTTVVTSGILTASNASALGATGPASGTTVSGSGVLQLKGGLTFAPESLALSGTGGGTLSALHSVGNNTWTGPITLAAATQINATKGNTLEIDGTISGPLATSSLTIGRSGTSGDNGTVLLTAANTYAGATTVSVGTLAISNVTALGAPVGMANAGTTVSSGATLQLQGGFNGTTFDSTERLTLNGSGVGGVGALQNISVFGTNTWAAPITLASGASIGCTGTGTLDITGVISGPGGLTKVGNSVVLLDAANTYTGYTTVAAGTLGVSNPAALGATGAPGTTTSGTTVNSGASLQLMGGNVFNPEALQLNGAGFLGGPSLVLGGALCNLTGNNTWTGNVTLLGDSTVVAGFGTQLTCSALPGAVTQDVVNAGHLLTINSIGDVVMADRITGSGGLQVTGGGTVTLAGNLSNAYGGMTTVASGKLNLAKYAGMTAVSGALTINSGAFLTGSGTISGNVTNYGTINVGGTGAAGSLTINGNYTQAATGALNIELGGTAGGAFDQLMIAGQASLNGTLNVSLLPGYQPNPGDAFAVVTFGSSVGGFAVASGLSLGNGESLTVVSDPTDLTLLTNLA